MDPRIYVTYVKILKYGWDVKRNKLSRLICWFIGKPYTYRLIGSYIYEDKGAGCITYITNAIDINLKSQSTRVEEYLVNGHATTKVNLYN